MSKFRKIYQTLQDQGKKNENEVLLAGNPCKGNREGSSWLGEGSYFWDGDIELAKAWGRYRRDKWGDYVIRSARYDITGENFFDLVGDSLHKKDFWDTAENMEEDFDDLYVGDVIEVLKSDDDFILEYKAIRAFPKKPSNFVKDNIEIRYNNPTKKFPTVKIEKYEAMQICIITDNLYDFVEPDSLKIEYRSKEFDELENIMAQGWLY